MAPRDLDTIDHVHNPNERALSSADPGISARGASQFNQRPTVRNDAASHRTGRLAGLVQAANTKSGSLITNASPRASGARLV